MNRLKYSLFILLVLITQSCFKTCPTKNSCITNCEPSSCTDNDGNAVTCNSMVLSFPSKPYQNISSEEKHLFDKKVENIMKSIVSEVGYDPEKEMDFKPCLCDYPIYNVETSFDIEGVIAMAQNDAEVITENGSVSPNLLFHLEGSVPKALVDHIAKQPSCFAEKGESRNCNDVFTSPNENTTIVAILDSGIAPSMMENGALYQDPTSIITCLGDDIYGYDFANMDNDPQDDLGHGTVVALSYLDALSRLHLNANEQIVLPVKVSNGCSASLFDMVCGMIYAQRKGAKIINMSMGAMLTDAPDALLDATSYLRSHGVLITTSSGNKGISLPKSGKEHYPSALTNTYDNVIEVGALCVSPIASSDNSPLSRKWDSSNHRQEMFAARGVYMESLLPSLDITCSMDGTSYGSPRIAALALLELNSSSTGIDKDVLRNNLNLTLEGYYYHPTL